MSLHSQLPLPFPPILFPFFFVGMWLAVTTLLGLKSGWYRLMKEFPDAPGQPVIKRLRSVSGSLGGVHFNNLVTIEICQSGMRIRMLRIFGVFSKPFLVPWQQVSMTPGTQFLMKVIDVRLADRNGAEAGCLRLHPEVADTLTAHAIDVAPYTSLIRPEASHVFHKRLLLQWCLVSVLGAAFFTLAPRIAEHFASAGGAPPRHADIPVLVSVGFPVLAATINAVVQYLRYGARRASTKNQL